MQIGRAKTPTMHGGIAWAEVRATPYRFLYMQTCVCWRCTSDFYSLPPYTVCQTQKIKRILILHNGVHWEKKVPEVKQEDDKYSLQDSWGCQSRDLDTAFRTAVNGTKFFFITGWQWCWAEYMHALCTCPRLKPFNHHIHQECEDKILDSYICIKSGNKSEKRQSPHLKCFLYHGRHWKHFHPTCFMRSF